MSKISWSEFIIVWLAICIVIDIVLTYLNKKSGTTIASEAEERKAKIKQLYTPYRDDVAYEIQIRRASMTKVEALVLEEETLPKKSLDNNEEDEKCKLSKLQLETSDIVKELFG